jgi:MFS family permease
MAVRGARPRRLTVYVGLYYCRSVRHDSSRHLGRAACQQARAETGRMLGFCVLPVRGVLYTLSSNPFVLIAIQLLDGIGAGIFGVLSILVVSDLTRGTGRFNITNGAISTATGIGAALSNAISGVIVQAVGYHGAFLTLASIAALAALWFGLMMPETWKNDATAQGLILEAPPSRLLAEPRSG